MANSRHLKESVDSKIALLGQIATPRETRNIAQYRGHQVRDPRSSSLSSIRSLVIAEASHRSRSPVESRLGRRDATGISRPVHPLRVDILGAFASG
jgi:hypothetical protein